MGKKRKNNPAKKINQPLNGGNNPKKLKPVVRMMLLVDLVALAIVQLLTNNAVITESVGTIMSLVGLAVLVAALLIQRKNDM